MVVTNVEQREISALSIEVTKVEEDPQGFLDKLEKIFQVMQASNMEGVSFASYHIKDVAYQWYKEWDRDKGDMEDRSHRGFYEKCRDTCFKYGQVGHRLKDCPVNKVATGANNILVVSPSTPTPGGVASAYVTALNSSIGQNRLYALVSQQEFEASPDVITRML
ncbi:uncharacterized protein LOC124885751 [Capsicum annuum]|uniref:uncharacterized protein LOC124885751 n=1 Tax=Capsicum annuum TaxID=4072 RepID=UPI001FB16964|nr:uncharacterized protein LOC124885751 [Capsicum annuum]